MSLSRTLINGIVSEDVQFTTTQYERSFAIVTIAVARPYPRDGQTIYDAYRVVLWGPQAEHASINVASGQVVAVEGRMQCRIYKNGNNVDREVWELVADRPICVITSAPDVEGLVSLVNA